MNFKKKKHKKKRASGKSAQDYLPCGYIFQDENLVSVPDTQKIIRMSGVLPKNAVPFPDDKVDKIANRLDRMTKWYCDSKEHRKNWPTSHEMAKEWDRIAGHCAELRLSLGFTKGRNVLLDDYLPPVLQASIHKWKKINSLPYDPSKTKEHEQQWRNKTAEINRALHGVLQGTAYLSRMAKEIAEIYRQDGKISRQTDWAKDELLVNLADLYKSFFKPGKREIFIKCFLICLKKKGCYQFSVPEEDSIKTELTRARGRLKSGR